MVPKLREVRNIVGFGAHGRVQRGDTLGSEHGLRAHRAGERDENHDVQRVRNGPRPINQIIAQRLTGTGHIVQAQHKRIEFMAGRHAMEGEAGRLAVHHHAHTWARGGQHAVDVEHRTARIVLLVLAINHRRFQLATGQRDQRINESPQFRRQRRIVQIQSKRDRPRHAAKDHVELLSGGV